MIADLLFYSKLDAKVTDQYNLKRISKDAEEHMKGQVVRLKEEPDEVSERDCELVGELIEHLATILSTKVPVVDRPILVSFTSFTDEDVVINLTGEAEIETYERFATLYMLTTEGHTLLITAIIDADGTLTDPSCEFEFADDTADTPPLECTIAWVTKSH